ncbi:MAG: ribonuclease E/G, partial [Pseudomonadota bacterium]
MSEEILINVTPPETRVALIENGVVQEVLVERTQSRGLVGNVYKGTVCRVLPGMQAAFVDAGLARAAFLHASDIMAGDPQNRTENIAELVREGQEVLVQVVKDPLGTKGARLTTNLSIPSRFLVFMPAMNTIGVSQRIEEEEERQRLRDAVALFSTELEVRGGFIVRTAGEGVDAMALRADMIFLLRLWESIQSRITGSALRELVHEDLPLVLRALRDFVGPEVEKIRIDSRTSYDTAQQFARR